VGVELSRKGGQRRWCEFNASDSAREGKRQDKSLLEDEAEMKERWHRVGGGEGGDDVSWANTNLIEP
jgi:hypothetical protein